MTALAIGMHGAGLRAGWLQMVARRPKIPDGPVTLTEQHTGKKE